MRIQHVFGMGARAVHLARRRVLRRLAAPETPAHIEELARFDHPLAARLAAVVDQIRRRDFGSADEEANRIERERTRLLAIHETLRRHTGSQAHVDREMTVARACRASRSPEDALALYLLVQEFEPKRILELGTNVGISSAYMASAQRAGGGRLTTLEFSPGRAEIAKRLHARLGLETIEYVLGRFDDTLESALREPVDFAFIDGHHEYRATLDYFERIWRRAEHHAVFIFDDIRWSLGMERAWHVLQKDTRLELVADLCGMGIAVATRDPNRAPRMVTPILA